MGYSQFLQMRPEVILTLLIVLIFVYDLFVVGRLRWYFQLFTIVLFGIFSCTLFLPDISQPEGIELFGGMYRSLPIIRTVKAILSLGTLIVLLQSASWLRRTDTAHKRGEFYILLLSTLLGMYFMLSAGHLLLFVLGLELATIPMACLVAFDKYRHHSAEAGAKYILSAMFGSSLMLYGISMLYGTTGTLYFSDMSVLLESTPLQILSLVFFFAGMGFKISLVPFHLWTADVYEGSPTVVTAYLSVVSKGAAAFALLTVLSKLFMPMIDYWQPMLCWVIVATITLANLFAIRQQNLKRFFAFSSISQAGYLMLGVIGGDAIGASATVFYILVYLAANLAIFGVISTIEQQADGRLTMSDYNGLYRTNPRLTLVMTLSLFSLAGIPPFAGFFSKFFIFMAAFGSGFALLVFIALLNTIISLYYYLLIVKSMYIMPASADPVPSIRSDRYMQLSLLLCLLGVLLFGLFSGIYENLG